MQMAKHRGTHLVLLLQHEEIVEAFVVLAIVDRVPEQVGARLASTFLLQFRVLSFQSFVALFPVENAEMDFLLKMQKSGVTLKC